MPMLPRLLLRRPDVSIVIGLDLSLRATGVVVLENGLTIHSDCIGFALGRDATGREKIERLVWLVERIAEIVTRFSPRRVAIEGPAFNVRGAQYDLGEIAGSVKVDLFKTHSIVADVVPPTTARKSVFGKGNLAKKQVIEMLAREGITFRTFDEADAYVVAMWAWNMERKYGESKG